MRVKELARSPFHLGEWYNRAGSMCEGLSFDDLYGCMVYPPEPDDMRIPADQWLLRVQFAAVCLLAQLGKDDSRMPSPELIVYGGKLPSYELTRICLGQLDWPVIPALTLLAWQAKEGLADREQALGVLSLLKTRVPEHDYCFFEHALACALSWFPGRARNFIRRCTNGGVCWRNNRIRKGPDFCPAPLPSIRFQRLEHPPGSQGHQGGQCRRPQQDGPGGQALEEDTVSRLPQRGSAVGHRLDAGDHLAQQLAGYLGLDQGEHHHGKQHGGGHGRHGHPGNQPVAHRRRHPGEDSQAHKQARPIPAQA